MSTREPPAWLVYAVFVAVLAALMYAFWFLDSQCDGILVRTLWGLECLYQEPRP